MALGEGDYSVMVYDRGGVTPIGELTQLTSLSYARHRDDTGICNITVTSPDSKCCALLANLRSVRNEIVLHRNGHRTWEGPVTRIEYGPDQVQIEAQDVTWFMAKRALEYGFDHTGVSYPAVIAIYDMLVQHYPSTNDPFNIGPFLTRIESSTDPNTAAKFKPYTRTVHNLLEHYASRGGVDYTVIGRRLIVYGTHTRANVLPKMTDEHLSESIRITEYGSEVSTRHIVTNNEEKSTIATAPPEWLDYYGTIDYVDNNVEEADGEPDEGDLEDMQELAERGLRNGYPAPVRVWLPSGSRLDPCYPAEFSQIQAGAWVPLESQQTCRKLSQWQKLQDVVVDWTPGSESINITLTKAPDLFDDPTSVVSAT